MNLARVALAIACGCLSVAQPTVAAPLREWTTAELAQHADVIVIATFVSTQDGENIDGFFASHVVRVDSTFRVDATLNGANIADDVTVMHYRYKTREEAGGGLLGLVNGPDLVQFGRQTVRRGVGEDGNLDAPTHLDDEAGCRYLLFLKRLENGVYVPASGQMEPWYSFCRLEYVGGE